MDRSNSSGESSETHIPYKKRKTFEHRRKEANDIKQRFPGKIPVIIERYANEKRLPRLKKTKFLIPCEVNFGQIHFIVRNRLALPCSDAMYLIVKNKSFTSSTLTMAEVYAKEKDQDDFLYVTYASEEAFGARALLQSGRRQLVDRIRLTVARLRPAAAL